MKRNRRLGECQIEGRQHFQLAQDFQDTVKADTPDTILKARQAAPRNTAPFRKLGLLDVRQNAAIRNPCANLLPKELSLYVVINLHVS